MTIGPESDERKNARLKRGLARRRRRFLLLSQWYGPERAEVEMAAHTVQPRSAKELIGEELSRILRPETRAVIRLRSMWDTVVGGNLAKFTEPATLNDRILTLKVRHSALLMELRESGDMIVRRVNDALGEEVCSAVRFTVG